MNGLRVSDTLELPLDVATETNALLAKKGAGKSNGGIVIVEELHRVDVPFIYVDPKGDSWGIRSSADGKSPGLPVVVFGGKHGDVPLEATGGALIADLVLGDDDRGYLSCVLDVSQFSYGERDRFLLAFGERLFRRKDEERVLHLVLEEAHEYLPQRVNAGQAQLVGMYQRIVKQGRFKGLGVTLISQRSAALSKDVLTQADNLFMLRTTGPQDRAAVKPWFDEHTDADALVKELPSLANGECYLWSPGRWPDPQHFTFRRRWTFDSGATPKVGEKRVVPRTLADVDLAAVKEAMTDTIEKAKADDPRELRKQITELNRGIAELAREKQPTTIEVPVEVSVLTDADRELIQQFHDRWDNAYDRATEITNLLSDALRRVQDPAPTRPARPSPRPQATVPPPRSVNLAPTSAGDTDSQTVIGRTERNVLTVLYQHGALTHSQIALLSGYSVKASTIRVALGKLRNAGYVDRNGEPVRATTEGVEFLNGDVEPLPQGDELLDYWRNRFGATERNVLDAVLAVWPNDTNQDDIAERTGYSATASTIRVALGKLRKVGVVDRWRISDDFANAVGL